MRMQIFGAVLVFMILVSSVVAQEASVPVGKDGDGAVTVESNRIWQPVTLTLKGLFADEQQDKLNPSKLNPFTDVRMEVDFLQGDQRFKVPGYFAADGDAANTSATSGNVWRAHFSPPTAGAWGYRVSFVTGKDVAWDPEASGSQVTALEKSGTFDVEGESKPRWGDQRSGMLLPQGTHLVFKATGRAFFKVGPDSPETLLAFKDFDGTQTLKEKKGPLKSWEKHVRDWNETDPTWQEGKGKGLLGTLNYLGTKKGVNAISFLTYNVDGDGSNVWPHVSSTDKMHFDCSKLDQWGIVFQHAQRNGLLLHFKLQETENDDHRKGAKGQHKEVAGALDGGKCGPQRKLYLRELIARFGHLNMLEWNLGEENTQTFDEQLAMAQYIAQTDAYGHNIVVHTYPSQQDMIYTRWLGKPPLTGLSLQNEWDDVHKRTLKWVAKSKGSKRPWVIANDEQGNAQRGVPPDPRYEGFAGDVPVGNGDKTYNLHDIRKQTLWGNLMAGGGGVMYYFGYKLPGNDLLCEDFRSRDKSWDYGRMVIEFLGKAGVSIDQMQNMNSMVGNEKGTYGPWCLGKPGSAHIVYLPEGGKVTVDLSKEPVEFDAFWFDPEKGGELLPTEVVKQKADCEFDAGSPGTDRVLLLKAK